MTTKKKKIDDDEALRAGIESFFSTKMSTKKLAKSWIIEKPGKLMKSVSVSESGEFWWKKSRFEVDTQLQTKPGLYLRYKKVSVLALPMMLWVCPCALCDWEVWWVASYVVPRCLMSSVLSRRRNSVFFMLLCDCSPSLELAGSLGRPCRFGLSSINMVPGCDEVDWSVYLSPEIRSCPRKHASIDMWSPCTPVFFVGRDLYKGVSPCGVGSVTRRNRNAIIPYSLVRVYHVLPSALPSSTPPPRPSIHPLFFPSLLRCMPCRVVSSERRHRFGIWWRWCDMMCDAMQCNVWCNYNGDVI